MKFHPQIKVYGDPDFRGDCPTEGNEQITAIKRLRAVNPLVFHPRNEGKRTRGQTQWQKAEGLTEGVSDIVIPAGPAFLCELKRRDHTKSKWQKGQLEYLLEAQEQGAFVCIALGADAVMTAYEDYSTVRRESLANHNT